MKRMTLPFARKYIINCIKFAGVNNFSAEHDISIDHLNAFMDPQRKLKPGPRLMAAVCMREIEPRLYVVGKDRK